MSDPSVLIAGASIAGPALAYWLGRSGWRTTVLERAPALRRGGQNVDLRGAGLQVVRRMGLEERLRAVRPAELGLEFVGPAGQVIARFPVGDSSALSLTAELAVMRGDLTELLVEATAATAEYRFGDRITAVRQEDDAALVSFAQAPPERFDLVVAADGIGSTTRRLVCRDRPVVRSLGVEATWATIPRADGDSDWWQLFHAPGGSISLRPDPYGTTSVVITRTLARGDRPEAGERRAPAQQRAVLRRTFSGAGWQTDRVLEALQNVEELYAVEVGQVRAPRWWQGSVVLLGDAACCPSPITGMGTTLAVVGAYVLAGEITSRTTLPDGLAGYERIMHPWVERVQKLPPGVPRLANPTSRAGVALLRSVVRAAGTPSGRWVADRLRRSSPADEPFELPRYARLDSP